MSPLLFHPFPGISAQKKEAHKASRNVDLKFYKYYFATPKMHCQCGLFADGIFIVRSDRPPQK